MKKFSSHLITALGASVLMLSVLSARAVSSSESESPVSVGDWGANTQIQALGSNLTNDILLDTSSAVSSVTENNPPVSPYGSLAGINDGLSIGSNSGENDYNASAYYGYNSNPGAKGSLLVGDQLGNGGEVITFNLNLTNSALGYNIASIETFAGWTDHASVSNQNFTLDYSTVADPTLFIPVTSVAYNPNNPTSDNAGGGGQVSEISLTDLDLTGVAALQFTFTADPSSTGTGNSGTGLWLEEVEGFGAATVPEPTTWAMMLLGVAGLVVVGCRRLVRA